MKNLLQRTIIFVCLTISLSLPMAFFTVAAENKDYSISDAWWEEKTSGRLYARWEKPEDSTAYRVRLYKESESRPVGAWKDTSVNGRDFTSDIVKKGTGTYYFKVYPKKADEGLAVQSEELVVDRDMLKKAKSAVSGSSGSSSSGSTVEKALEEFGPGASSGTGSDRWLKLKDGNWIRQKADGSLYKGQWLEVDGKKYLFDSMGYMQKNGWRSMGSTWYYLGADGAVLKDTTTPDGFTVDSEGRCIVDGQVYKAYLGPYLMAATTGDSRIASLVPVTMITFRTREYPSVDGNPKNIDIVCSAGAEIISTEFSKPHESWQIGRSVNITVVAAPSSGYYFKKGLKFSPSSDLTMVSSNGNEQSYTIKFRYLPKVELAAPDGVYITEEGVLHWNKVKNASYYTLSVRGEDTGSGKFRTTKNEYDLSEYLDSRASVVLTACGNGNNNVKNSVSYRIEDLDIFCENNTVDGSFKKVGDRYVYKDADGEKFSGWKEILGNWYHFTKGQSDGPGWYQDKSDGYWYYFDSECRMETGTITDNGREYFLNDGSLAELPMGAWKEN